LLAIITALLFTSLANTSAYAIDVCAVLPEECEDASNTIDDTQNSANDILDDASNAIEDEIQSANDQLNEELQNLEDELQNLDDQADQEAQKIQSAIDNFEINVISEVQNTQQSLTNDVDNLDTSIKKETGNAQESVESLRMAALEASINAIDAMQAEIDRKTNELEKLSLEARQALDNEINNLQAEALALYKQTIQQLETEAERLVKNAESDASEYLSMINIADFSSDLDFSSHDGFRGAKTPSPALPTMQSKSWSMALYSTQGALVLPVNLRINSHLDFGMTLPFEQGSIDRGMGRARVFAKPLPKTYLEARAHVYKTQRQDYPSVGARINQGISDWLVSLDYTEGELENRFNFARRKLGFTHTFDHRHTIFFGVNQTIYSHQSIESTIKSLESQLGYRLHSSIFGLIKPGVDLDFLVNTPQRNTWTFRNEQSQLDGRGWSFLFGVGTQF
jgi:hypothetical protein